MNLYSGLEKKIIHSLCHIRRAYIILRLRSSRADYVFIKGGRCGFFGNMFMTLNGIRLCEFAGITPRPLWGKESLFYEEHYGENVWEYYFENIMNGNDSSSSIKYISSFSFRPDAMDIGPYHQGFTSRETYAQCIKRFVKLKPEFSKKIEEIVKSTFEGAQILGVHCRMTDNYRALENRKSYPLSCFFYEVDRHLSEHNPGYIFLTSDSSYAVKQFVARYGKRLLVLPCLRSEDWTSVHGHYDKGIDGSPFLKGWEVIRDAYLLSKTAHLIGSDSKVTKYALTLNSELSFTSVY